MINRVVCDREKLFTNFLTLLMINLFWQTVEEDTSFYFSIFLNLVGREGGTSV